MTIGEDKNSLPIQMIGTLAGLSIIIGAASIETWKNSNQQTNTIFSSNQNSSLQEADTQSRELSQPSATLDQKGSEPVQTGSEIRASFLCSAALSNPNRVIRAIKVGDIELVQEDLACGVDPDIELRWRQKKPTGRGSVRLKATLLHAAVWNRQAEIVQALVSAGAEIDKLDSKGISPLMRASSIGDFQIVDLLIESNSDINLITDCSDCDGETALTVAAQSGHATIVRLLLDAGARAGHQNRNGLTALDIAKRKNHADVIQVLQDD
ncbi:MAG: ankyrin repeat domain-containing protein [Phormidesmis sp.]